MKNNTYIWSYLSEFFFEWEIFQTKAVEEIKTRILCSIIVYDSRAVYKATWKIL
jgi:hypothetical protein